METRRYYAFTAVQIIVVSALLWRIFTLPGPWDLQRSLGTVLVVAGVGGIAIARYQLGRSFAIRAEAHQLVTRGVYSRIRNPIYFFGTFLVAGFVLLLRQPIGLLFVAVMVVIQVLRARREASVLEAAFGDAYRDYRRNTWF
jgi:protein-S-isoprenylcysteine O-methyltransferase Ste14